MAWLNNLVDWDKTPIEKKSDVIDGIKKKQKYVIVDNNREEELVSAIGGPGETENVKLMRYAVWTLEGNYVGDVVDVSNDLEVLKQKYPEAKVYQVKEVMPDKKSWLSSLIADKKEDRIKHLEKGKKLIMNDSGVSQDEKDYTLNEINKELAKLKNKKKADDILNAPLKKNTNDKVVIIDSGITDSAVNVDTGEEMTIDRYAAWNVVNNMVQDVIATSNDLEQLKTLYKDAPVYTMKIHASKQVNWVNDMVVDKKSEINEAQLKWDSSSVEVRASALVLNNVKLTPEQVSEYSKGKYELLPFEIQAAFTMEKFNIGDVVQAGDLKGTIVDEVEFNGAKKYKVNSGSNVGWHDEGKLIKVEASLNKEAADAPIIEEDRQLNLPLKLEPMDKRTPAISKEDIKEKAYVTSDEYLQQLFSRTETLAKTMKTDDATVKQEVSKYKAILEEKNQKTKKTELMQKAAEELHKLMNVHHKDILRIGDKILAKIIEVREEKQYIYDSSREEEILKNIEELEKEKNEKIAKLDDKLSKMISDYKSSVAIKIIELEISEERLVTFKDVNTKASLNLIASLFINAENKFMSIVKNFKNWLLNINEVNNLIDKI